MKTVELRTEGSFISRSHERCRLSNVNPDRVYSSRIITGEELEKRLDERKELILTAAPFMDQLYNFVKGSGFFAILTDEEGCILNVIGDEEILSKAFELKMLPGAYMSEEHIGTNAMSIVITEGTAVQISGDDHFIKAYHRWTCSASPIKDGEGRLIGVLDLTGNCENVHPHTLGMVVAAANAIERMMDIEKYNQKLELSKGHMETIMNTISSGILTSDLSGKILTVNKSLLDMFGYSEAEMMQMNIRDLFEGFNSVAETVYKGGCIANEDVYIKARRNKLQFTLSTYPVFSRNRKPVEIVYVFVEIQKTRKLAGKITGGRAIYTFDKIIGGNKRFSNIIEYAKKIADSRSTVLITGESGTGKEVFAQSIHNYGTRGQEPFIAVNCGAIPKDLIESELFGYEEGAFTGAKRGGYAGKFEIADGGTIFLDEIGEMSQDMQVKLLRVIEEGIINRIGGPRQIPVNVRIIAATNKDLKQEVEKGHFRRDLFYRLNVLPINLPPLRERKDDIPLLMEYFMARISKRLNKRPVRISEEYISQLESYDWPGNVRELENMVELIINTESLQLNMEKDNIKAVENFKAASDECFKLEHVEKNHIIKVLREFKGNISLAAKALGIGRNTLYRKMESYEIECSKMERCAIMGQTI